MTIHCFELPSDIADWPDWLDRQLVSDGVGRLVDEFETIGGTSGSPSSSLTDLIGDDRQSLLDRGTGALGESQLRALIGNPSLLNDLQELVLTEGGPYWTDLAGRADHAHAAREQWSQIQTVADRGDQNSSDLAMDRVELAKPSTTSGASRSVQWMAIAAAILLAVGGWWFLRDPGPGWGFDNAEMLAAEVPPDQYMTLLADAADDWFNKRPDTNEALAKRLQQYSQGCQILLDAPHEQLARVDREWLLERCAAWKEKIDELRVDVLAGDKPFEVALTEADQIIEKLEAALRDRDVELIGAILFRGEWVTRIGSTRRVLPV